MIMELSTTGYALSAGLASSSVLMGSSSSMDGVRKFFLSERSDIDSIIENSREFEEEYGIGAPSVSEPVMSPSDGGKEDNTPSGVLGSASVVGSGVVIEGVKAWFNYKYLVIALLVGVGYKLLTGDKRTVIG